MRPPAGSILPWPNLFSRTASLSALRGARLPLLVFLGYLFGAQVGFQLTFPGYAVSTLWAPNAVLTAAFIMTPVRSWWMVLAGAFPAHLATQLGADVPAGMIPLWFISNTTEALLGAVGVRAFLRGPLGIDRLRNLGVVVLFAGVLAPFFSSFLDAAFVRWIGHGASGYWELWRNRFFSNVLAALTIVPLALAWGASGVRPLLGASRQRYVEAAFVGAALLTVGGLVFGSREAGPDANTALLYAPLPLLVWAAIRFGPIGASTSGAALVLVAVWSAVHGRGPFASLSPQANSREIQLLFSVLLPTLLSLAAVLEERRKALTMARKSSEQLHLALDAAQMGTLDWALAVGDPSPTAGVAPQADPPSPQDSLSRFLATVHPNDRPELEEAIRAAVSGELSYQREFRVVRGDGSVAWVLGKGKVLHDDQGGPSRVVGVHMDIDDKKAADALIAAENQILGLIAGGAGLEEILNSLVTLIEAEAPGLRGSVLLLDPDGVHIRHGASPSLPASYTGAVDGIAIGPRAGSCGTAMYLGYPVISADIESDPLWEEYRELALSHGLCACWSTPILSQGRDVIGSFAIYPSEPRRPAAGELEMLEFATHLAAIALERDRAAVESEQQRRELTHLGRVATLGGFSGALAHELSQPLASILSNAQAAQRLLERDPPSIAGVREILADIVAADRRAAEVIERLRAMLMNNHGERAAVDLCRVTMDALELAGGELRKQRVQVELQLPEDLPPVLGDSVQLEQVVLNLIANATDAMASVPPAERRLQIVARSGEGGSVHLSVADHGVGVSPEIAARIGQPFVTSKPAGLGLGLSISKTIVQAHGGRLWFETNVDHGAVFHLRIPAHDSGRGDRAPLERALSEADRVTRGAPPGAPLREDWSPGGALATPQRSPTSPEGDVWQPLTQHGYVLAVT